MLKRVFVPFSAVAVLLWLAGAVAALRSKSAYSKPSIVLTALGLIVYIAFVAGLWVSLNRPPLRTLGETRLWYSLFMIASGWLG